MLFRGDKKGTDVAKRNRNATQVSPISTSIQYADAYG
jgi:hypothetical protein